MRDNTYKSSGILYYYCDAKLRMKIIRLLLLPFSVVYGGILWLRNTLYNKNVLKSTSFEIKTICIGNLSLGGTGKTPHIEYILELLKHKKTAVLSRGYGRNTAGTRVVTSNHRADEVGDEPLQIAQKFPNTTVVVDENRRRGMEFIQNRYPQVELVLLDDAFQHRKITAGLNIVLTTYVQPFTKDYYLPAGNLRDHKIRAKQADIIIVTKCPDNIQEKGKDALRRKLSRYARVVLFNKIAYKKIKPVLESESKTINDFDKVILITGIAKPEFLYQKASKNFKVIKHYNFRDHYPFTAADLSRFHNFIDSFALGEVCALTTEKDAVRMRHLFEKNPSFQFPVFYWEIGVELNEYQSTLEQLILNYAKKT